KTAGKACDRGWHEGCSRSGRRRKGGGGPAGARNGHGGTRRRKANDDGDDELRVRRAPGGFPQRAGEAGRAGWGSAKEKAVVGSVCGARPAPGGGRSALGQLSG